MMIPIRADDREEERIRKVYAHRHLRAARYSLFNPAQLLATHDLEAALLDLLKRKHKADLRQQKILEIGCGTGYWLRRLIDWGAQPTNLMGVDLLPERISEATTLSAPGVKFICRSAADTGVPNQSIDLVLQFTVFTSILDNALRRAVAREMVRVLKPDGLIIWYDYHVNNPRNPNVRRVPKSEIKVLFPDCLLGLRRITLAPPISRFVAPYSPLACLILRKLPFLCTHYLASIEL